MGGWMDAWLAGWLDGWLDGRRNGWTNRGVADRPLMYFYSNTHSLHSSSFLGVTF